MCTAAPGLSSECLYTILLISDISSFFLGREDSGIGGFEKALRKLNLPCSNWRRRRAPLCCSHSGSRVCTTGPAGCGQTCSSLGASCCLAPWGGSSPLRAAGFRRSVLKTNQSHLHYTLLTFTSLHKNLLLRARKTLLHHWEPGPPLQETNHQYIVSWEPEGC